MYNARVKLGGIDIEAKTFKELDFAGEVLSRQRKYLRTSRSQLADGFPRQPSLFLEEIDSGLDVFHGISTEQVWESGDTLGQVHAQGLEERESGFKGAQMQVEQTRVMPNFFRAKTDALKELELAPKSGDSEDEDVGAEENGVGAKEVDVGRQFGQGNGGEEVHVLRVGKATGNLCRRVLRGEEEMELIRNIRRKERERGKLSLGESIREAQEGKAMEGLRIGT